MAITGFTIIIAILSISSIYQYFCYFYRYGVLMIKKPFLKTEGSNHIILAMLILSSKPKTWKDSFRKTFVFPSLKIEDGSDSKYLHFQVYSSLLEARR
ncbi:hypothetical protein V7125_18130 [Neobacillus vireti]